MANTGSSHQALKIPLAREERRKKFVELGWWVSVPLTTVPAHWLYEGEQRLDAGYYAQEAAAALRIVSDCGLGVSPLKELVSKIFILGRFRRIYATNREAGWPYLSASEVFEFHPTSERWLARNHAPKRAEEHFAKSGWILVSASGTVGRTVIATKRLERFFLTHDLLRIVPDQSPPAGYLYAYLSSWIGQALMTKDKYGSAIKHLEPHHLEGIPVPLLPQDEQYAIHEEIMQAYALRDKANDLLDEADELLHKALGLPRFDESLVPYLTAPPSPETHRPEMPHPKAFIVRASELNERLDASYHVPVVSTIVKLLHRGKYKLTTLGETTEHIIVAPRFKRVYVGKEHGVPFLQGSHLPQIKFHRLQYLSSTKQKRIERWIIHKNWVLVTCSGTIGRIALASSYLDQWAASQHILRIVPSPNGAHPGYITAFLMTPYGQHQLKAKIYGGVVDELTAEDTAEIWIPDAPDDIQRKIGERVSQAFELKDKAMLTEEETIHRLEMKLQNRATS